jgi:hypothetical protein
LSNYKSSQCGPFVKPLPKPVREGLEVGILHLRRSPFFLFSYTKGMGILIEIGREYKYGFESQVKI